MFLNGVTRDSTVKNAAKLAVYEEHMMRIKKPHAPEAVLVDSALKLSYLYLGKKLIGCLYYFVLTIRINCIVWCATYTGAISEPCWSSAPKVNHNEFLTLNWFSKCSGSSIHGYTFCHSEGDNLLIRKNESDIIKYVKPSVIQTLEENGDININKLGGTGSGFLYRIPIP